MPKHMPLKARCGACVDLILEDEDVVALSGNDDSTACAGHTTPFPFPLVSMRKTLHVDG
ncbi:hypothetical protein F5Y06DRAFT_297139 [Hypoxylon sp. FL0890]|nr:hypothetical protein F5Y06DRAFT_297139 [Hypoxylon sp. FL0890]